MTTFEILKGYGYEERNGALWTGSGSLVAGFTCTIAQKGENTFGVEYHKWYYDEWGDPLVDEHQRVLLSLPELWEFVCNKRTLWLYSRHRFA